MVDFFRYVLDNNQVFLRFLVLALVFLAAAVLIAVLLVPYLGGVGGGVVGAVGSGAATTALGKIAKNRRGGGPGAR